MANLEDTATITVSSQYSASYDKAYACDNNTGTEWASAGDGANSWIQFTWGTPVTIREIRFVNRPGDPWGIVRLTFSDGAYTDVWTWMEGGADFVYPLLHPVTTTSVRMQGPCAAGASSPTPRVTITGRLIATSSPFR